MRFVLLDVSVLFLGLSVPTNRNTIRFLQLKKGIRSEGGATRAKESECTRARRKKKLDVRVQKVTHRMRYRLRPSYCVAAGAVHFLRINWGGNGDA